MSDRSLKRAALDYRPHARIAQHDSWDAFSASDARASGRLVLFTTHASRPYTDFAFAADDVLLFGRESAGAPEAVHAAADTRLVIPMAPGPRSLNVVSAAAMALGEALRQTSGVPAPEPAV